MNCRLVSSLRSQFFQSRLFSSSQATLRSTTQRLGITSDDALFAALGDLHGHGLAQNVARTLRKGLAHIATSATMLVELRESNHGEYRKSPGCSE